MLETTKSFESRYTFVKTQNRCKQITDQAKADFNKTKCHQFISCSNSNHSFCSLAKVVGHNLPYSSKPFFVCPDVVSATKERLTFLHLYFLNSELCVQSSQKIVFSGVTGIHLPKSIPVIPPTSHSMPFAMFHHHVVQKILQLCETDKVSDPDGILPTVLECGAAKIICPMPSISIISFYRCFSYLLEICSYADYSQER